MKTPAKKSVAKSKTASSRKRSVTSAKSPVAKPATKSIEKKTVKPALPKKEKKVQDDHTGKGLKAGDRVSYVAHANRGSIKVKGTIRSIKSGVLFIDIDGLKDKNDKKERPWLRKAGHDIEKIEATENTTSKTNGSKPATPAKKAVAKKAPAKKAELVAA